MIRPTQLQKPTAVITIVKINIIVFFLWFWSFITGTDLMIKHFLVSWAALDEGRYWTLITSVFSHNMLFHILINMYVFFGFGTVIENILGSKRFLLFYLMAGVFASVGHCFVSAVLLENPGLPALGASGAVAATILLFSLMFPQEKILLMGIVPMPAYAAAVFFVGLDLWGLIAQTRGSTLPIGYGAHLGGALFGLIYYFINVKRDAKLLHQFR